MTIALRHAHSNDTLAALHRHPSWCRLLDITAADPIPPDGNLSRCLDVLGQPPHLANLRALLDHLVQRLGVAVPDLGRDRAGDSTTLNARPKTAAQAVAAEITQGLPQPCGGKRAYRDEEGKVVKVVEGFGYPLHLLVDVTHAVRLAYHVSDTAAGDNHVVPTLVHQAPANLPAGPMKTLAYDKAADDEKVHEAVHAAGVKPLIPNRALCKEALARPLPGGRSPLHLVPDEAGTVYGQDTVRTTPVRQRMASVGYEAERGSVRSRCPAWHEGWDGPSPSQCSAGRS